MGRSSAPPPPPDYQALARQQGEENRRTFETMLNAQRYNTFGPGGQGLWFRPGQEGTFTRTAIDPRTGQVVYSREEAVGGDPNSWRQVELLSPEEQFLRDQALRQQAQLGAIGEGLLSRIEDEYSRPLNLASGLPAFGAVQAPEFQGLSGDIQYTGGPFDRARAEEAYYNRAMRFIEPQLQAEEQRLRDRLIAEGFDTGSAAAQEQLRLLGERHAAIRADAADRAIQGGSAEATAELGRILQARQAALGERQAAFGAGLQGAEFAAGEGQRQLAHALALASAQERDRARTLSELNAFRGTLPGQGGGGGGDARAAAVPHLMPLNLVGMAEADYNNLIEQYNARRAQRAGTGSAIGGVLGGLAGAYFGQPMLGAALGSSVGGWIGGR